MGDIKEEDWNLPECKYECEDHEKCFCNIPSVVWSQMLVNCVLNFSLINAKVEHKKNKNKIFRSHIFIFVANLFLLRYKLGTAS